jgi:sugar transferase EpsL
MQSHRASQLTLITKRLFDLLVSLVGLIVLSPVALILCLLVGINLGGPVIFSQVRPGYHGKLFRLYKFRSMRNLFDAQGKPLSDELRLTQFGKFLRASSLDELPELINVLLGHMSLVGPRPLLVAYLERYSPEQARRHDVLPGITGWAQVNGRNAISWEEKFKLDVWYVDHQSFWLDIKILLMTVSKAIKRESINAPGSATAPEFMGNNEK